MTREEDLLLEEYKILENRYRSDTNRIWSQAQILIAANLIAMTALSSLFSTARSGAWLINPRFVVTGISWIGLVISLAWFFSLAADRAYRKVSLDLLCDMEQQLKLPMKVFSEARKKELDFKGRERIGGIEALLSLSKVFMFVWWLMSVVVWLVTV